MKTITINARQEQGAKKETFKVRVPVSVTEGIKVYGEDVVLGMIDGTISSSAKVQHQKVYRDARNDGMTEEKASSAVLNHKPALPSTDRGKSEVQKLATRALKLKGAEADEFLIFTLCSNLGLTRDEAETRVLEMKAQKDKKAA